MGETMLQAFESLVSLASEKISVNKDPTKPYIGLENIPSGGSSLLQSGTMLSSVSVNNVFRAGDILLGKLRPRLRKSVRAPFEGYCSTDILVLRTNEGIDPIFAGYVAQSDAVFSAAIRVEEGTKMPRCSWRDLKEARVFCPDPVAQRRIGEILSTVDEAIEQTEALIAKTQQIKAGLMHDLFTRGVTPDGHLRPPRDEAPHLYQESPLGWIPKEWAIGPLEKWARLQGGYAFSSSVFLSDGIPLIRISNIVNGVVTGNFAFLAEAYGESASSFLANAGDVLIAMSGATTGKLAQVRQQDLPCLINQRVGRFIINDSNILSADFLWSLLHRPHFQNQITIDAVGGAQPNVSAREIEASITVCPLIDEQGRISEKIACLTKQFAALEEEKRKHLSVKHGLMHDLLTGHVRVPRATATPA